MKRAQTVLEYLLIFVLIGVIVVGMVSRFDLRNIRNFTVFGEQEQSNPTILTIPEMTQ